MKFKLNKFFACKSILAFLLGLYSIFMIFFRSYIIDSVKSEYFFIILFSFVGLVFLKRIILIFDKKISDYNYEFYKSDVESELISKFKKIAISDIEDSNVRDMYDAAINESGFNKDLIDNASKIIKSLIIFLGTIFVLFKFSVFYSVIALLFIIVMLFIEAYNFNKSGDIWKNYRANMRMANYYSNVLINNEFLGERKIFRTETFFNDKFIKSSDLITLDEPTSAIDPLNEKEIYDFFEEHSKNKTEIIVTHRMGAIKYVDRIIVLDRGNIVEDGNFDELIKRDGMFAKIYKSQSESFVRE